jgi:hypothetical protein
MNKPIFENEEEAWSHYKELFPMAAVEIGTENFILDRMVKEAKEKGYIKKSELEEAKNKWNHIKEKRMGPDISVHDIVNYAEIVINELEKRIKELEK